MKVRELFESTDPLITFIRKHCPKNFKGIANDELFRLYRATNQEATGEYKDIGRIAPVDYLVVYQRNAPRRSLTGVSYFMDFVSQSPDWDKIPKRWYANCTTPSYNEASDFDGSVYLVIPFDNVNLFALSSEDFNYLRVDGKKLSEIGDYFNKLTNALINAVDNTNWMHSIKDEKIKNDIKNLLYGKGEDFLQNIRKSIRSPLKPQQLKDLFDMFDDTIKLLPTLSKASNIFDIERIQRHAQTIKLALGNMSITQWFVDNITPEKLGVTTYTSLASINSLPPKSEVWFEGAYLGIKMPDPDTELARKIFDVLESIAEMI